jgi:hypothetical protein
LCRPDPLQLGLHIVLYGGMLPSMMLGYATSIPNNPSSIEFESTSNAACKKQNN